MKTKGSYIPRFFASWPLFILSMALAAVLLFLTGCAASVNERGRSLLLELEQAMQTQCPKDRTPDGVAANACEIRAIKSVLAQNSDFAECAKFNTEAMINQCLQLTIATLREQEAERGRMGYAIGLGMQEYSRIQTINGPPYIQPPAYVPPPRQITCQTWNNVTTCR